MNIITILKILDSWTLTASKGNNRLALKALLPYSIIFMLYNNIMGCKLDNTKILQVRCYRLQNIYINYHIHSFQQYNN
jgi:hypothetical protein